MPTGKFMLRFPLVAKGYILLQETDGGWRLTCKYDAEHTAQEGVDRVEAVEAMVTKLIEVVQRHTAELDTIIKQYYEMPSCNRPGFRPGRRERVMTQLSNQRAQLLLIVGRCVPEITQYLVAHGWPVPAPRLFQVSGTTIELAFPKDVPHAYQAAQ